MVGQLVESNGDRFYLAPKLHHPNACTVGKVLPKFDQIIVFRRAAQNVTSRNRKFRGRRCYRVVQILQLIKYFVLFQKVETFSLRCARKGQFFQKSW